MFNQSLTMLSLLQITYTLVGGIRSISVETALKRSDIGLGDSTDSVIESKDHTWMVTRNTWEKASWSTVAQVCGEHVDKRMVG